MFASAASLLALAAMRGRRIPGRKESRFKSLRNSTATMICSLSRLWKTRAKRPRAPCVCNTPQRVHMHCHTVECTHWNLHHWTQCGSRPPGGASAVRNFFQSRPTFFANGISLFIFIFKTRTGIQSGRAFSKRSTINRVLPFNRVRALTRFNWAPKLSLR